MLARMPWADATTIVSSMRMMHNAVVFQAVVELLVAQRPGELEAREHVGEATALGHPNAPSDALLRIILWSCPSHGR